MQYRYILAIALLGITSFSYALTRQQSTSIHGNPIQRQDNYTINSRKPIAIVMKCSFINTGNQAAKLNIWDSPKGKKPYLSINLKPASGRPTVIKHIFRFELRKHWWCNIYPPHKQQHWTYCHYFSISDATLSSYHGFHTWNKTTHSKDTQYICKITKPKQGAHFFGVKPD